MDERALQASGAFVIFEVFTNEVNNSKKQIPPPHQPSIKFEDSDKVAPLYLILYTALVAESLKWIAIKTS